jgi:hypothetical protein
MKRIEKLVFLKSNMGAKRKEEIFSLQVWVNSLFLKKFWRR